MYEGQNGGFSSNAADVTNTAVNDPGVNTQPGTVQTDSGLGNAQESVMQDNMPQGSMPQENVMQESAPQVNVAPENAVQQSTVQGTPSQDAVFQNTAQPVNNGYYNNMSGRYGTFRQNNPDYRATQYSYNQNRGNASGSNNKEKKKGGIIGKIFLAAALGIVFGVVGGFAFWGVQKVISIFDNTEVTYVATVETVSDPIAEMQNVAVTENTASENVATNLATNVTTTVASDVSDMVEDTMPSLVSITSNITVDYYYYTESAEAGGSGIIIGQNDDELLVVTNYHVIADADSLIVNFIDNENAPAKVKGTDENMDLAVIAVKLSDIPSDTMSAIKIATMGDSENLKAGQPVVAIGNAMGYGLSVTTGVVSAVNREMNVGDISGTFIQTDAAINPGNSGGALLDINGNVIGINSSKLGGMVVEGMGYAIPISAAQPIIENLMTRTTRTLVSEDDRGYLGIVGATVTPQDAQYYGLPEGAYISSVTPGSAADKAGIQAGDYIVGLEGIAIDSMQKLQGELQYYSAGDTVEVEIMRNVGNSYKSLKFKVTLDDKSILEDTD